MADTLSTAAPEGVVPSASSGAIRITRTLQSAVLRLRGTILALKLAADAEHDYGHREPPLYWPDLIDALKALTPDADALDEVVDELERLQCQVHAQREEERSPDTSCA